MKAKTLIATIVLNAILCGSLYAQLQQQRSHSKAESVLQKKENIVSAENNIKTEKIENTYDSTN